MSKYDNVTLMFAIDQLENIKDNAEYLGFDDLEIAALNTAISVLVSELAEED